MMKQILILTFLLILSFTAWSARNDDVPSSGQDPNLNRIGLEDHSSVAAMELLFGDFGSEPIVRQSGAAGITLESETDTPFTSADNGVSPEPARSNPKGRKSSN